MSKRGRSDFTGGTGDVRPQIMTLQVTQGTVNQETVQTFQTPIQRISTAGRNMAQVMEILAVDYYLNGDFADFSRTTYVILGTRVPGNAVNGGTGSNANFVLQIADHGVLSAYREDQALTTSGGVQFRYPFTDDLMDGAGHGTLVATDTLTVVISSVGGTAASVATLKVWYRLINVDVMEYVGIVQSQQ